MTTKKQQSELEAAVGEWVFEGLANSWTTTEILNRVVEDWRGIVGLPSSSKGFKDLAEWQGKVLELVGLGLGWEVAEKQRVRSAGIVLGAFSGAGEDSIMASFGSAVAMDVLQDVLVGREELMRNAFSAGSLGAVK